MSVIPSEFMQALKQLLSSQRFSTSTVLIAALGAPLGLMAQGLPVSAPTQLATSAANSRPASPESTTPRPEIVFEGGLLTVDAQNSSLNQILGEISRVAGMKVTGRINEERVFGTYGPGKPFDVVTRLLEGTGINILLHESADHTTRELVLSARTGGVTPPSPNANMEPTEPPPNLVDRWRRAQERYDPSQHPQGLNVPPPGNRPRQNANQVQPYPQLPNGVRPPNQPATGADGDVTPPQVPNASTSPQ